MGLHLFIFYRDLRLYDNTTLIEMSRALPRNDVILPIFLMDRREWKSDNQYQFLLETLMDLDKTLQTRHSKLHVLQKQQLNAFLSKHILDIKTIGWNAQYENPLRYDFIRKMQKHIHIIEKEDSFLVPPDTLKHKPFQKFTPFYRHCTSFYRVRRPDAYRSFRFGKVSIPNTFSPAQLYSKIQHPNPDFYTQGGYRNATRQLNIAHKTLRQYGKTRNIFSAKTSFLSSYLSLNILSIRQVYYTMKPISQDFIRELYWRDFYLYVSKYFPKVMEYGSKTPLISRKNQVWKEWRAGKTGKPIVDACMRQMNTTGYMHNRGRMIVASYLVKDLKVPFKYGEEYFERVLIDHNKSSNNGGWQWVNGSGVDSQPPYQKFSMIIQNKKYDPECVYIRKWLPELKSLTNDEIFDMYV